MKAKKKLLKDRIYLDDELFKINDPLQINANRDADEIISQAIEKIDPPMDYGVPKLSKKPKK